NTSSRRGGMNYRTPLVGALPPALYGALRNAGRPPSYRSAGVLTSFSQLPGPAEAAGDSSRRRPTVSAEGGPRQARQHLEAPVCRRWGEVARLRPDFFSLWIADGAEEERRPGGDEGVRRRHRGVQDAGGAARGVVPLRPERQGRGADRARHGQREG